MVPPGRLALSTSVFPFIFLGGEVSFTPALCSFWGLEAESICGVPVSPKEGKCRDPCLQPHHGKEKTDRKKGQCSEVGSDLGGPGPWMGALRNRRENEAWGWVLGVTVG